MTRNIISTIVIYNIISLVISNGCGETENNNNQINNLHACCFGEKSQYFNANTPYLVLSDAFSQKDSVVPNDNDLCNFSLKDDDVTKFQLNFEQHIKKVFEYSCTVVNQEEINQIQNYDISFDVMQAQWNGYGLCDCYKKSTKKETEFIRGYQITIFADYFDDNDSFKIQGCELEYFVQGSSLKQNERFTQIVIMDNESTFNQYQWLFISLIIVAIIILSVGCFFFWRRKQLEFQAIQSQKYNQLPNQ